MAYYYDKKTGKRYKINVVPIVIALCLLVLVLYFIIFTISSIFKTLGNLSLSDLLPSSSVEEVVEEVVEEYVEPEVVEVESMIKGWITNDYNIPKEVDISVNNPMWNLVLINLSYGIEEEFTFDNAYFDDRIIDIRIGDAYKDMYEAALENGHTLVVKSGYRSINYENTQYNNELDALILTGVSEYDAMKKLDTTRPRVGHTEHHTGLAIDVATSDFLSSNNDTLGLSFAETEGFAWLVENCNDFGFILRYPENKVSITNVEFEPWHFRYVGVEHAKAITAKDLTLEEYLTNMDAAFKATYPNITSPTNQDMADYALLYPDIISAQK